jgi:signal transduction histidine kinase
VAHDIRSPLSALSIVSKVSKALPDIERELIVGATQRINEIAEDLLSNNQIKAESAESVTRTQLIQSVIREKQAEFSNKQLTIEMQEVSSSEPKSSQTLSKEMAKGLKRILSNLINNAAEATKHKGNIKVYFNNNSLESEIIVEDNGPGFSNDSLDKIQWNDFNVECQRGFGLPHAKSTLSKWGGDLKINRKISSGAQVILTLPSQLS